MSRKTSDCRSIPSESGCSLSISGEEDEVMRAATAHAVDVHGHTDDDNLRSALRASLPASSCGGGSLTAFRVQRQHARQILLDVLDSFLGPELLQYDGDRQPTRVPRRIGDSVARRFESRWNSGGN